MMRSKRIGGFLMLLVVLSSTLFACQAASSESTGPTVSARTVKSIGSENILTVGDIDPDKPARKFARFQPLADYLAENLSEVEWGSSNATILPTKSAVLAIPLPFKVT